MTIEARYKSGDPVPSIAIDSKMEIAAVMKYLRINHHIRKLNRTVVERLNQDIQLFLDAYFLDEKPIAAFRIMFDLDDDEKPLTAAYVYRILDELQVTRRRKNNKLPRLKRMILETAIKEYQSGREFGDVLLDSNLNLGLIEFLDELKQRQLFRPEDADGDKLQQAIHQYASRREVVANENVTRDL